MEGDSQPPDHRSTKWNAECKQLESLLLSTVHMWTLSKTKVETVTMVLRHFVAGDVYDSMCELAVSIGAAEKPGGHRNTAERSAGELYAGELYDMFKDKEGSAQDSCVQSGSSNGSLGYSHHQG